MFTRCSFIQCLAHLYTITLHNTTTSQLTLARATKNQIMTKGQRTLPQQTRSQDIIDYLPLTRPHKGSITHNICSFVAHRMSHVPHTPITHRQVCTRRSFVHSLAHSFLLAQGYTPTNRPRTKPTDPSQFKPKHNTLYLPLTQPPRVRRVKPIIQWFNPLPHLTATQPIRIGTLVIHRSEFNQPLRLQSHYITHILLSC